MKAAVAHCNAVAIDVRYHSGTAPDDDAPVTGGLLFPSTFTLSILPRGVPRLGVGVGAALETPRVGAKGRACHCVTAGPIRLKVHKSLQIRQTQALCRGPSHARTRIAGCQHRSANGGFKLGVARVVPSGRVARRALFHCHAIRPTLMGGLLLIE